MKGRYVVVCSKGALYKPVRKEIQLGERGAKLAVELEPDFGVLEVRSEPAGAGIELDGEPTGQVTPFTFPPKKSGSYRVKVSKELFLSESAEVTLGRGRTERVELRLAPNFGSLLVESEPAGVEVALDGKATGRKTPARFEGLPAGVHQVESRSDRYRGKPEKVKVERGQEARVRLGLEGVFGLLAVTASVVDEDRASPVEAEVWIDGWRVEGTTPLKEKLLVGSYPVRVLAPEASPFETTAVVREGEKTSVEARLPRLLPEEVKRQREAKRREELEAAEVRRNAELAAAEVERRRLWEVEADKVRPTRSAHHWSGSVLLVAGVVGGVVGPVLWGVNMQDAMDARDAAYQVFLVCLDEQRAAALSSEVRSQDELAKEYRIGGWVSVGLGGAMLVTGIVLLATAPSLPELETFVTPGAQGGLGFRF